MLKKFIFFMLFSGVVYSSTRYNMQVNSNIPLSITINGKEVFCSCGKPPVCVIFFESNPKCYCPQHVPEIERAHTIRPEDVQNLLDSINNPMCNWDHQGLNNGK